MGTRAASLLAPNTTSGVAIFYAFQKFAFAAETPLRPSVQDQLVERAVG